MTRTQLGLVAVEILVFVLMILGVGLYLALAESSSQQWMHFQQTRHCKMATDFAFTERWHCDGGLTIWR
jgi:hypothetical protein